MAGCGILRKSWRLLPQLIQILMLLALLHLLSQGFLMRMKKSIRHVFSKGTELDPSFQVSHPRYPSHHHGHGGVHGRHNPNKSPRRFIKHPKPQKRRPPIKKIPKPTTTTTTPAPLPPLKVLQEEFDDRLRHLKMTCSKWRLGEWADGTVPELEEDATFVSSLPTKARYQALFVSTEKNISFCPVAWAGSNWVSKRLLGMSGLVSEDHMKSLSQPPAVLARHRYPFLLSWELYPVVLAQSTNLLVVRHPFDRLLGYYRGELEEAKKNPNGFLSFGRRIVTKYRKKPEFKKSPTFWEFIQFILDEDEKYMDESWQSVAKKCTPCHIPFSVIGHYESLWRDVSFAWTLIGQAMSTGDYPVNEITSEIRRKYFSQLTLRDMIRLHKKYKLDFELFGYTLEEHLSYAATGDDSFDPEQLAALPRADTSYLLEVRQGKEKNEEEGVPATVDDKENNEEQVEESDDGSGIEEDNSLEENYVEIEEDFEGKSDLPKDSPAFVQVKQS